MTPSLLAALHAALTAEWKMYLGERVAHERAANALQSIAMFAGHPDESVENTLMSALRMAEQPEYGGKALRGRLLDDAIAGGLNAITTVLLAHVRSDETRFDALMQPGLR